MEPLEFTPEEWKEFLEWDRLSDEAWTQFIEWEKDEKRPYLRPMAGNMANVRFCRDASNRLSVEMPDLPSEEYPALCGRIKTAFSLIGDSNAVACGLDQIFMTFRRGDQVVELCWDIWSGFFIAPGTPESETLADEIGKWLVDSHRSSSAQATE